MYNTDPYTIKQSVPVAIDLSVLPRYDKLRSIASQSPNHPINQSINSADDKDDNDDDDVTEKLILSAYTAAPIIDRNPNYWFKNSINNT